MISSRRRATRVAPLALLLLAAAGCGGPEARKAEALAAGESYLAAGNYEKARIEMRNVLQIDPNDVQARFISGQISEKLQNIRQAAGHYQATLDIDPTHVEARASLATIYVMAGLPDQAVALVNTVLEGGEPEASLITVRGAAFAQMGMEAAALEDARTAYALDPEHERAIQLLAGTLTERREFEEAAQILDTGIAALPDAVDLQVARALLAEQSGDDAAARSGYAALIAAHPEVTAYRFQLAAFHQRAGRLDDVEAALRNAAAIDDGDEAILRLVSFLSENRGFESAERELVSRAKNDVDSALMLADFYGRENRVDEARVVYTDIVARDDSTPQAFQAQARLAALALQRGDRARATELVDAVLTDNPRDAGALLARANIALAENRPDDAIVDLRALVRDDPEVIAYHLGLARAYLLKGQGTLAEEALRSAVRAEPGNLQSRVELAQFFARNGKVDEAENLIRSVILRQPTSVLARDTSVRIAITRGDWASAFERARAITEIAQDNPVGHYLMGLSHEGLGEEPEAVTAYERALDLQADYGEALAAWSRIIVRNGEVDRALKRIRAARSDSANAVVLGNLEGEVLVSGGRPEAAMAVLEETAAQRPDWWVLYRTMARAAPELVQKIEVLERGFKATGAAPGIGFELAALQEQAGRPDAAIGTYEEMLVRNAASDLLANNLAMLLATYREDVASLRRAEQLTQQFGATDNPAYLNTYGWTRLKSGSLDVALPALRQAVTLEPGSPIMRYHLGVALMQSGEVDAAREQLSRALEIAGEFPGSEEARAMLASADATGS